MEFFKKFQKNKGVKKINKPQVTLYDNADKIEIERGQDPNCPIGKDCSGSILINPVATPTGSDVVNVGNVIGSSLDSNFNESSSLTTVTLPSDATSLRQILLESGMDKTMLGQFSDQELLDAYQEAFKQ